MNKQHIKEIICRAKRGKKKIMEKLNRAQKCSILGPQNLGSGGARAPGAPPGSAPAVCPSVCLSVCSSVQAITFEPLHIETSFFVSFFVITMSK